MDQCRAAKRAFGQRGQVVHPAVVGAHIAPPDDDQVGRGLLQVLPGAFQVLQQQQCWRSKVLTLRCLRKTVLPGGEPGNFRKMDSLLIWDPAGIGCPMFLRYSTDLGVDIFDFIIPSTKQDFFSVLNILDKQEKA